MLSSIKHFLLKKSTIFFIILLVVGWFAVAYSKGGRQSPAAVLAPAPRPATEAERGHAEPFQGMPEVIGDNTAAAPLASASANVNPMDLLPRDSNSAWGAANAPLSGSPMIAAELANPMQLRGIDTHNPRSRIPNLQERSDPVLAKVDVGPWQNSPMSGEVDEYRVTFEIGERPNRGRTGPLVPASVF